MNYSVIFIFKLINGENFIINTYQVRFYAKNSTGLQCTTVSIEEDKFTDLANSSPEARKERSILKNKIANAIIENNNQVVYYGFDRVARINGYEV